MEKMIYLYIFALAILVTIYCSLRSLKQNKKQANKLFKLIVGLAIAMLLIDITHEYLNSLPGLFNAIIMRLLSVFIFGLPSFVAVIWFNYSHLMLYRRLPKRNIYYYLLLLPLLVNTLLALASLIWPLYFVIDASNTYSRGNIFFLSIILQYFYLIVPIIMVLARRSKINDDQFYPLVFFTIPPMVGGLIQAYSYGLLLVLPTLAFSVFIAYIFIQSRLIATDFLTGLRNKGALENHVENLNVINKKGQTLSAVVLDLDGLKLINDTYGHLIGDQILSAFSEALTTSFDRNDFTARIGGDEFIVIKYVTNKQELDQAINALIDNLNKINNAEVFPSEISFSYGYKVYKEASYRSIKEFLEAVDQMMYEQKAIKGRKTKKF